MRMWSVFAFLSAAVIGCGGGVDLTGASAASVGSNSTGSTESGPGGAGTG